MEIGRMAEILEAEVICGQESLNKEISLAVASDMMCWSPQKATVC